ncbi:nucleotidyltransferase [Legionella quinlivanii]|uniref:Nucleotidyltransferase n=1 Tax=Legionella quinlivanii TaxID=45073 RepID=A0A0W0XLN3_9GAMM|nr:malonate decarboxylase holo-[acyl-carrier-protein] synthase [Legionella quinlivanii]KTD45264.1 nucleotidyltransferase [Legionella quinlivanii]MCW8450387.1 malonate decarboxylase holo-[acyl-carrier-protein] synthase [Legionella quinlivanii]SEG03394.1 phosphoribosyl-dephospho-CoA transferase [Legionella quinlivanii DSM 21216]STY11436.1 nucleotidyltransferase [Legionella quinlivanii]
MRYLRHHLCYLNKRAVPEINCSPENLNLFKHWLGCGYPLIMTRQPPDIPAQQIQLAIPYFQPEQARKIRASFILSRSAISRVSELPALRELFPDLNYEIKVYGSYCWQYLTKEPYVQAESDLDLLVDYRDQSFLDLKSLYAQLQSQFSQQRIDGEIRFAGLGDCSWRELLQLSGESLLFKSINKLRLLKRDNLYALFPSLLN